MSEMIRVLETQKKLNIEEGAPDYKLRIDRLDRCIAMVQEHKDQIIKVLQEDFGNRDPVMSSITEIETVVGPIKHAKKNLKKWMKVESRKAAIAPLGSLLRLLGAKAWIKYQPKGVVGIISPWNFPFQLAIAPMAGAIAAGNRIMLEAKIGGITPAMLILRGR